MTEGRFAPPIGGEVWAGVSTTTNLSAGVYVGDCPFISVFGNGNGAATITLYYSMDGTNYFASGNTITLAGSADFGKDFTVGAPWIALKSSANITATAYISAKG